MTHSTHRVHGLAGDEISPDWPALTSAEVDCLLQRYPALGRPDRISWHSPRPLSAACLVETDQGVVFVKRHHRSVRTVAMLEEEHRFMAHLRARGVPVPEVFSADGGHSALAIGEWVYEVHQRAAGIDRYREAISWSPLGGTALAQTTGRALAAMHNASEGHLADQRSTHILVARSELLTAPDPAAALQAQLPQRPGLADYLRGRRWQQDLATLFAPWQVHRATLAGQPRLWTHGDWHVSNLCWSDDGEHAAITAVVDFGLCAANFALFDLATAIERNAIAWLELDTGMRAARNDIALALIQGYHAVRPLGAADLVTLAALLPLVHVDFALSEVEYFHAITRAPEAADVAYDTFLIGHAAWFGTAPGQALLEAVRHAT